MFVTPASLLYRLRTPHDEANAWGRFVELYTPLLFRWAQQLGLQDSDCADLVQDVFLILWRKLPEFDYDSGKSFYAWLKTVFVNRHRSRLRQRGPLAIGVEEEQCIAAPAERLAEVEDANYLIGQAFRLIQCEFSPLHQQVFRAYVLDGQSPEEISRQHKISPGTVYGVKSKILSRLRQ